MTLSDAPLGRRVYLDTNLYIYLFEGLEEYRRSMADLTAEIDRLDVAVIASLVVGTALTALNQGDAILTGQLANALAWKIPLTYCVPFLVATYGALSNSRG